MNINFGDILNNIFDGLKRVTPALIALLLLASFLLFAPKKILKILHLDEIDNIFMIAAGAVFVLTASVLLSLLIFMLYKKIQSFYNKKKLIKAQAKLLKGLSKTEAKIIIDMFSSDGYSAYLSLIEGYASILERKGMILKMSNLSVANNNISLPYMLQPWLIEYLKNIQMNLSNQ